MIKIFGKIVFVILIIVVFIVMAAVAFFSYLKYRNEHYWKYAEPAGEIERKYTAFGNYDVSCVEFEADNAAYVKYEIWYPSDMTESNHTYPLVVMANGTGVTASQYKEVFRHLASWGFVVIGNEDANCRTGASSAAALDFILRLNEDSGSDFCGRIDTDRIGIAGHSQGGVGAIHAVTAQENGDLYRAVFAASTTSPLFADVNVLGAEWSYDMSKITIPCFMVAGTGKGDAGTAADRTATEGQGICPLWALTENYDAIPDTVDKVMARRSGKDHGDMLRYADGYMTAWFMYYLKEDARAGEAFFGDSAEILSNENWQDIKIKTAGGR
ncbi:MAG: alpha/beta hydrolase [Lachnospiraceae bacterium]|nr:alpha/beta hydrolase [Lachnospiraceae bacterium]